MSKAAGVRIAVLITYYNEGPFLTECLDSLRRSGSLPDEILVYDDASSIPPESFVPPDLPVRILKGATNHGPAYGRNILLQESGSDYIHFHDADDLFASGWCDEVRARLQSKEFDAVFTEVAPFRDGQDKSEAGKTSLRELAGNVDLVRYCLVRALLPAGGTYLRDRVLAIGGYSCKYWQSEDYDFHIRLAAAGLRYTVIQRPLVWQRHHANNRSKDDVRVWTDAVQILAALAPELPALYRQDICDAIANHGRTLHQIGAVREAENAFAVAKSMGNPRFEGESFLFRTAARLFGPNFAERIGSAYRFLLPARLRELARTSRHNRRIGTAAHSAVVKN